MTIESELREFFLKKNVRKSENIARDVELIAFYYGFKDDDWPTLEDTAQRFDIGTKERVRQLLEDKFRKYIKHEDIKPLKDLLVAFIEILGSREYWSLAEFEELASSKGITKPTDSIKGIFNLIEDMGLDHDFGIYTPDFKKASRASIEKSENIFLFNKLSIKNLKEYWKKLQLYLDVAESPI